MCHCVPILPIKCAPRAESCPTHFAPCVPMLSIAYGHHEQSCPPPRCVAVWPIACGHHVQSCPSLPPRVPVLPIVRWLSCTKLPPIIYMLPIIYKVASNNIHVAHHVQNCPPMSQGRLSRDIPRVPIWPIACVHRMQSCPPCAKEDYHMIPLCVYVAYHVQSCPPCSLPILPFA